MKYAHSKSNCGSKTGRPSLAFSMIALERSKDVHIVNRELRWTVGRVNY